MNFTQSMSIARKLAVLNAGAILGIIILTATFLISERTLILEERTSNVRQAVETAYGVLDYYQKQEASGALPRADAQKKAMEAIKVLRYGNGEYFWLNDMQPKMIMHPIKPELDNKDLSTNKDPTGKFLFVEFANMVRKAGAGPVDYMWPKPGSDKPVQKVSYVKGFEPWGWILGSGVYVDTVDATVRGRAVTFAIGAVLLAALLLGVGVFIARGLLRQLGGEPDYASSIARSIAGGDLTVPISVKRDDDSSMVNALKGMRDDLARIVGSVRTATETIATASSEIAAGNSDLSARTENQASSLEETAASMEELTATVRQNADSARTANELAASASEVAQKGGAVVSQVVETMASIDSSSRKIVDIISVIDGIAFQTNILALNAAVEAARAGEQGRGFAVVASEVRNLAQRSAAAAKEIKDLIGASVETVGVGNTLVAQAGSTMQEVVDSVHRVRQIINEISTASHEQSAGIAQVNEAISQMDAVTQQNAALVEQAAAAAASMQQQSAALLQAVGVFRVESDTAGAASRRLPRLGRG
ncbi:methyl-accepting chemotaxis protein [Pseudoduganella violaceinigra]|uniref:methyl-accepting chemotaxis protein n=1 Tax=Pseudoduganella violaceinigra TaxID=246602 RepID=UPI0004019C7F|nr:methyl-accepting chemotaxis protein [Pseudoduganella violaceinigra]